MSNVLREIIALSVIAIVVILLINSPSILADLFMVIFNFVALLVQGIQNFVLELADRIV